MGTNGDFAIDHVRADFGFYVESNGQTQRLKRDEEIIGDMIMDDENGSKTHVRGEWGGGTCSWDDV